jgi:hypothetical protein
MASSAQPPAASLSARSKSWVRRGLERLKGCLEGAGCRPLTGRMNLGRPRPLRTPGRARRAYAFGTPRAAERADVSTVIAQTDPTRSGRRAARAGNGGLAALTDGMPGIDAAGSCLGGDRRADWGSTGEAGHVARAGSARGGRACRLWRGLALAASRSPSHSACSSWRLRPSDPTKAWSSSSPDPTRSLRWWPQPNAEAGFSR